MKHTGARVSERRAAMRRKQALGLHAYESVIRGRLHKTSSNQICYGGKQYEQQLEHPDRSWRQGKRSSS